MVPPVLPVFAIALASLALRSRVDAVGHGIQNVDAVKGVVPLGNGRVLVVHVESLVLGSREPLSPLAMYANVLSVMSTVDSVLAATVATAWPGPRSPRLRSTIRLFVRIRVGNLSSRIVGLAVIVLELCLSALPP